MKIWDRVTTHFGSWKGLDGAGQVYDGFIPKTYSLDLVMNGTGLATALTLVGGRIRVVNRGATTEDIKIAFGASSALAITALGIAGSRALTGLFIPAHTQGLATAILGVPEGATHYAVANATASDTQTVSITQGI